MHVKTLEFQESYKNYKFLIYKIGNGYLMKVQHELTSQNLFKEEFRNFRQCLSIKDILFERIDKNGFLNDFTNLDS